MITPFSLAQRLHGTTELVEAPPSSGLPWGIGAIDTLLPEGIPRGAVTELCAPMGLAHATRILLAMVRAAQQQQQQQREEWCAWIDPSRSLYAPGLVQAGIELPHLLVVQPDAKQLERVAVRMATSRAFRLIIVDRVGAPGCSPPKTRHHMNITVRRMALAVKGSDTTVVMLNSTTRARRESLPVALRIELGRPERHRFTVHVSKDRRGHVRSPIHLPIAALAINQNRDEPVRAMNQ